MASPFLGCRGMFEIYLYMFQVVIILKDSNRDVHGTDVNMICMTKIEQETKQVRRLTTPKWWEVRVIRDNQEHNNRYTPLQ